MPKPLKEAHHIAGPANRDRGRAERVLEDKIPADDPGDELAQGGIGVRIGAAGDWNHGSHFGVAQAGKGAGNGAETRTTR